MYLDVFSLQPHCDHWKLCSNRASNKFMFPCVSHHIDWNPFPKERLHASFSTCLKFVRHVEALYWSMTDVIHCHIWLSQIFTIYAKTTKILCDKVKPISGGWRFACIAFCFHQPYKRFADINLTILRYKPYIYNLIYADINLIYIYTILSAEDFDKRLLRHCSLSTISRFALWWSAAQMTLVLCGLPLPHTFYALIYWKIPQ